jgi:hypothetical protein
VAWVDVVAHGLADEVGGDGVALHASGFELGAFGIAVGLVGLFDFKVIAPAGELQAIIAKAFALLEHGVEGKIGPLAGEESDGTWHDVWWLNGDRKKEKECGMSNVECRIFEVVVAERKGPDEPLNRMSHTSQAAPASVFAALWPK